MSMSTVQVTLTGVNPVERFLTRKLLLTENDVVHIGRASKRHDSILPNERNGLFDCPVISRDHARLYLNELFKLIIVDIGSLHGTRVNGCLLKSDVPRVLDDLDLIAIGSSVTINDVQYQPQTFQVRIYKHDFVDLSSPQASPKPAALSPRPPVWARPSSAILGSVETPAKAQNTFVVPDLDDDDDVCVENQDGNVDEQILLSSDSRSSSPSSESSVSSKSSSVLNEDSEDELLEVEAKKDSAPKLPSDKVGPSDTSGGMSPLYCSPASKGAQVDQAHELPLPKLPEPPLPKDPKLPELPLPKVPKLPEALLHQFPSLSAHCQSEVADHSTHTADVLDQIDHEESPLPDDGTGSDMASPDLDTDDAVEDEEDEECAAQTSGLQDEQPPDTGNSQTWPLPSVTQRAPTPPWRQYQSSLPPAAAYSSPVGIHEHFKPPYGLTPGLPPRLHANASSYYSQDSSNSHHRTSGNQPQPYATWTPSNNEPHPFYPVHGVSDPPLHISPPWDPANQSKLPLPPRPANSFPPIPEVKPPSTWFPASRAPAYPASSNVSPPGFSNNSKKDVADDPLPLPHPSFCTPFEGFPLPRPYVEASTPVQRVPEPEKPEEQEVLQAEKAIPATRSDSTGLLRVSIPNIIEPDNQSPQQPNLNKRKVDEIEGSEATKNLQEDEPTVKRARVEPSQSHVSARRPAKKVSRPTSRLHSAATTAAKYTAAGLLGGVVMVGGLLALPDSLFT